LLVNAGALQQGEKGVKIEKTRNKEVRQGQGALFQSCWVMGPLNISGRGKAQDTLTKVWGNLAKTGWLRNRDAWTIWVRNHRRRGAHPSKELPQRGQYKEKNQKKVLKQEISVGAGETTSQNVRPRKKRTTLTEAPPGVSLRTKRTKVSKRFEHWEGDKSRGMHPCARTACLTKRQRGVIRRLSSEG